MAADSPSPAVRFLSPFKTFGPLMGLAYCLNKVLRRLHRAAHLRCYYLNAQPIAAEPRVPERFSRSLTIREITPDDAAAIAQMPLSEETLAYRFAQPAVCLGCFKGDTLAGYIWLCLGPYAEDEVHCIFIPTDDARAAWDFGLYIMPKHRMSFTFPALWDAADRYISERGYRYAYSRVSCFNEGSNRAHAHFGTKRIGTTVFLCLGPLQLMVANVAPYLNVTFGKGAGPQIRLGPVDLGSVEKD